MRIILSARLCEARRFGRQAAGGGYRPQVRRVRIKRVCPKASSGRGLRVKRRHFDCWWTASIYIRGRVPPLPVVRLLDTAVGARTHLLPQGSPGLKLLGILGALVAGCDAPVGPTAPYSPNVRAHVTGRALANLDGDGRFQLQEPSISTPYPMITSAMAFEMANAYVRTFLFPSPPSCLNQCIGAFIESRHGTRIDFSRVTAEERMYFAISAYEPVPDSIPMPTRREVGHQYLAHLLEGKQAIGSLAVAAFNTDVSVQEGKLRLPIFGGNHFFATGIPRGSFDLLPASPEAVVELVAQQTGIKVAEVPRLILPRRPIAAVSARWELVLERPSTFLTGSGRQVQSDVIYVKGEQLYLPIQEQPITDTVAFVRPGADRISLLEIRIRRGAPVEFETVRVR